MPEENRRQTPPPAQPERDINERIGVAKDAELAGSAGGPRPAPNPNPAPAGPINKAADLAGEMKGSSAEPRPESTPAPPRKPGGNKV